MTSDALQDDLLVFADESEVVADRDDRAWPLLIVDDEEEVHAVTRMVLEDYTFEGKPLRFLSAYSGEEGIAMLEQHPDVAVVLLDVVMETGQAGLEMARRVRQEMGNAMVRIILRTGQPGQAPEKDVIVNYDINDYKQKTELTSQRLFTTVTTALRSYRDLKCIDAHRNDLKRAWDKAMAAEKAKSQLMSNMSHEFRTPLNAIVCVAEMLRDSNVRDRDELIAMLQNSSNSLLEVLNNLLDLAAMQMGSLTYQPRPLDLDEMLGDLHTQFETQAQAKGLDFSLRRATDISNEVVADRKCLKQVLSNLLFNALAGTEKGSVSLNVEPAGQTPDGRPKLLFRVEDTGVGIPRERLGSIFEPFSLAEDFMTKQRSGAGLGLAVCRDLARLMGGSIHAHSVLGKGSRFELVVPCGKPAAGNGFGH